MTGTRRWLEDRRRALLLRRLLGGVLLGIGLLMGALSVGILLARLGIAQRAPVGAFVGWTLALVGIAWGVFRVSRAARDAQIGALAETAERAGDRRAGWVAGPAAWEETVGDSALAGLADRQVSAWLATDGDRVLAAVRRTATRSLVTGASIFTAGTVAFAAVNPQRDAGMFWRPWAALARGRGPVTLEVDRVRVARGDRITATIQASGRSGASLWVRSPGEPWGQRRVELDSAGEASVVLGPLFADRYLRAVSGNRSSETIHVEVELPALLTDFELLARYATYLDRPDEPVEPGPDPVLVPEGTSILTRGAVTVPVAGVTWRRENRAVPLRVDGARFSGELPVRGSGRWRLTVALASGGALAEPNPELHLVVVRDSAPVVAIPAPGADTTMPLTLKQSVLVDARDDHGLRALEIESWRVSRLGLRSEAVTEAIALPESGTDHALTHWVLDLNGRGFLPGDTAFVRARARDNAPVPHTGQSRVLRLRLLAMWELRQAMREASQTVAAGVDSLVAVQEQLTRRIEDLAAERERGAGAEGDRAGTPLADQLPFESVERARELLGEEEAVTERARSLRDEIRTLSESAWSAGLTDPAFHEQLREIQTLLERALSEELVERLETLRDALAQLHAAEARDALRQLAEAAQQLREELSRGRELFERAAIEGDLTTLAADADELAQHQREWNAAVGQIPDSASARAERDMAAQAAELAERLAQLDAALDSAGTAAAGLEQGETRATRASQSMTRAAQQAATGAVDRARQSGAEALEALDPLGASLREERNRLREQWREEVMAELDRALVEGAQLAQRQQEIEERLRRGESGADVRGSQAAVKAGVDRVAERLKTAAGKNALVSPQLAAALGLARQRMEQSLGELQQPNPGTREAGELAGQSLDALNQAVYAMVRSRGDVAGAQSGSGLAEALERLAELANEQGGINAQSGGLLPMMQAGGVQLLEQLRVLAAQERSLAAELERMRAGGELSGAGALAEAAREIADDLAAGRLDREVLERLEQLFRRLLDAGRSLESEEEDQRRERVAETARPGNLRVPEASDPAVGGAPRFPFPTWESLRGLSPEQRRLILDYFRRLNDVRP